MAKKDFFVSGNAQKAKLADFGTTRIVAATGEVAGPFTSLQADLTADATVTFTDPVTAVTYTAWIIPAGGWYVGPCADVTVTGSGVVSGKLAG